MIQKIIITTDISEKAAKFFGCKQNDTLTFTKIDDYFILDKTDIETFNEILYKEKITSKDKQKLVALIGKAKAKIENGRTNEEKSEIVLSINHFIRFYEFLIQVSCFKDAELHKKYNFLSYLFL